MPVFLFPLILGAFAVGTEGFMLGGVLPWICADLDVSVATAGFLVTLFSLTYAVGSPILTIVTSGVERRRLIAWTMGGYVVANLLAAATPSFFWLGIMRMVLAMLAGTFMPAAIAYATASFDAQHRGRAVSLVYGGMTFALVAGVPAGTVLAAHIGWRAAYVGVALIAALTLAGTLAVLPRREGLVAIPMRRRLAVAKRRDVIAVLALTMTAVAGPFIVTTYIGAFLQATLTLANHELAGILFLLGVASFFGNMIGGHAADHWNRERYLTIALILLIASLGLLSFGAGFGTTAVGVTAIVIGLVVSGLLSWSFAAVQQARVVTLDPTLAPITVSLNTSALYFGSAAGAALGALIVRHVSVSAIGWGAALCEVGALILFALLRMRSSPRPRPEAARSI